MVIILFASYQCSCPGERSLLGAVSSLSELKEDRGGTAASGEEKLTAGGLLCRRNDAQHRSPRALIQVNIHIALKMHVLPRIIYNTSSSECCIRLWKIFLKFDPKNLKSGH